MKQKLIVAVNMHVHLTVTHQTTRNPRRTPPPSLSLITDTSCYSSPSKLTTTTAGNSSCQRETHHTHNFDLLQFPCWTLDVGAVRVPEEKNLLAGKESSVANSF